MTSLLRRSSFLKRTFDSFHSLSQCTKQYNLFKSNDNKNQTLDDTIKVVPFLSAASAVVNTSSNLVTTAAGYQMAAGTVTAISYSPLVAFAFVQISGLDPIRQIVRDKATGQLSPFPFISLYTNCAIWTLYGVLQNDSTILIANAAGVIAGALYTGIFHINTENKSNMMKYYLGSSAIMIPMLSSPLYTTVENSVQLLGTFGCASAVILMASPLATVGTVIKERSTASMPFIVSLAMTINGTCWGSYGWFVLNDVYVYLPNILGASAGAFQLLLHAIYRR